MKMMIIEDDPTMMTLLKTIFELEGYLVVVHHETDLLSITQAIENHNPDILLLDVYLRKMSGLQIAKSVRQSTGRNIKILMSSGMYLRQECIEAGADDFILKPYMPEELILKVKDLVAQNN